MKLQRLTGPQVALLCFSEAGNSVVFSTYQLNFVHSLFFKPSATAQGLLNQITLQIHLGARNQLKRHPFLLKSPTKKFEGYTYRSGSKVLRLRYPLMLLLCLRRLNGIDSGQCWYTSGIGSKSARKKRISRRRYKAQRRVHLRITPGTLLDPEIIVHLVRPMVHTTTTTTPIFIHG